MPDKTVYSLTEEGNKEIEKLMLEISAKPIRFFLDFYAVIVNLSGLSPEKQKLCLADIESNIITLKTYLEETLAVKEKDSDIPETGMAVLKQQLVLANAIET